MSVFAALGALKGFVTPKNGEVNIASLTFRLHKLTAIFLLTASILTTSKQFFGENIHCMVSKSMQEKVFESYCFMTSTYVLPPSDDEMNEVLKYHQEKGRGRGSPLLRPKESHPGVQTNTKGPNSEDTVYQNYYQWVCFVLFLQAISFYLPYRTWKQLEGGRLATLLESVTKDPLTEKPLTEQVDPLAKYLHNRRGRFNSMAYKYFWCQVANAVNAVAQLYLIDLFLGGDFLQYGSSVLNHASNSTSPFKTLTQVFPRVTKCNMNVHGPTGEVVRHSGLCTLPINIINEKIYLFFWFWLLALSVGTALSLGLQALVLLSPRLRYGMLRSSVADVPTHLVSRVVRRSLYGDYIMLLMIANNIDAEQMKTLIVQLADRDGVTLGFGNEDYSMATLASTNNLLRKQDLDLHLRRESFQEKA